MSIVVLGSANLDLVYRVQNIPGPGETVLAASRASHPGGKGNNQATAAVRAGAAASFIVSVGQDEAGAMLLDGLESDGVRVSARRVTEPTGTALITVADSGENSIVVDSGANSLLAELTETELGIIEEAGILLMQLEVPVETVGRAAAVAHAAGALVVLNAAPIRELEAELLAAVDLLIVNEHEAFRLLADTGLQATEATVAAELLLELVPAVIITLGAAGALVAERGKSVRTVPAFEVTAVDTTGAGDTFCGALVAALEAQREAGANDLELESAARFASAAAAISVQRAGAVPSIPGRQEIEDFLGHRQS
ncbi:ribokinase [Psychromicrobium silvestre]|uniref:Ribokinase n=1 Tax=Psychromicrobium silvestre TaxID=1645614 RepID=A0A7Y9LQW5_9MICC|nr:ribokinase [Psychromicrobium silvestre]NYE93928.1 ribokinase [Psychromicrobium silvestre]